MKRMNCLGSEQFQQRYTLNYKLTTASSIFFSGNSQKLKLIRVKGVSTNRDMIRLQLNIDERTTHCASVSVNSIFIFYYVCLFIISLLKISFICNTFKKMFLLH